MAVDRSKFKTLSASKAVEADKELDAQLGKKGGNRTGFINLKDGKNFVRLYPAHPSEDGKELSYALPKVTVFLPLEIDEKDKDGNVVMENNKPKKKIINRPVFNSKIHGGTPKDLVEEYIRFTVEKVKELYGDKDPKEKAEKQRIFDQIYGKFEKKIQGINYSATWVAYADILTLKGNEITSTEFGRLEIKKSVKERLNQIAISTESEDEPVSTDPFTDLENTRLAVINYNKNAEKANLYYSTEIDSATVKVDIGNGRSVQANRVFPFTDEDLDKLLAMDSLESLYVNTFKRKDFLAQLESLQFFDKKNNIGTFQYDDWEKVMTEISGYYPEDEEGEESNDQNGSDEDSGSVEDEFSDMTRIELKAYIKANGLEITVRTSMEDKDIANLIREKVAKEEEPEPEPEVAEDEPELDDEPEVSDEAPEDDEPEDQVEDAKPETTKASGSVSALRQKLRNG